MYRVAALLACALIAVVSAQGPVNNVLTQPDFDRFKALAGRTIKESKDVNALYYAASTLSLLNAVPASASPEAKAACVAATAAAKSADLQQVYFAAGLNSALKCGIAAKDVQDKLKAAEKEGTSASDAFHAIGAAKHFGVKGGSDVFLKQLQTLKDDTLLAQVYLVQVASLIPKGAVHNEVFSTVEDILGQADEVNERYLHLEGGLGVTSLFIQGAFALAEQVNKPPMLLHSKLLQMADYVLSRKDSQAVKNVYFVLLAAKTLSENKFIVPVSVTLASHKTVTAPIEVRVSTLMGTALPGVSSVTADQVNRPADNVVVVNKQPLLASPKDKTLYSLDLLKVKPDAGFYTVTVGVAAPAEKAATPGAPAAVKLAGVAPSNAKLEVKVTTELAPVPVSIAIIDSEASSITGRTQSVTQPQTHKGALQADSTHKIVARFPIKDKLGKAIEPHQVFMRLLHKESDQEVFFVCEKAAGKGDEYEFELSLRPQLGEKNLKGLSGEYQLDLIVGGAVITNSFMWHVANIHISFFDSRPYAPPAFLAEYKPKPEIHHKFREPEPRPAVILSQVAALAVLLPFVGLLIGWNALGVNVSNLSVDLPTIGFHGGLAAIFGLYYCYWAHLNMFQTLKCLTVLGALTFFAGHRLLRRLATNRLNNRAGKKDD